MRTKAILKPIYPAALCAILTAVAALTGIGKTPGTDPTKSDPREQFHVYLVIGDDGMAGKAELTEEDPEVIDRCFILNGDDEWEPAKAPLNRYSTIRKENGVPRLGPAYGFVKAMLKEDESISIGLVVNAGAGANLEKWDMKSNFYREARRRTKVARSRGTLKGVLWHGGGSKNPLRTDLDHLKTLIADVRADQRLLNLPFVVGESPNSPSIKSQLAVLSADVHATAVASSSDLVVGNQKQVDAAGVIRLGERYAEEMRKLQAALKPPRPAPAVPLIDTHVHAFSNRPGGLDVVAQWMARNGVEQCIVSPIGKARASTPAEREVMLANFRKHRGKIHRFCLIEPGEVGSVEEAVKILKKEMAEGAIGLGEHYGRDLMFDDPKNLLLYEACEQVGLPIMFHIDSNKNMVEMGMRRVERVLEMFPECKIIAHAYWWLHLPEGTCDRMLQEHPNLYADVSGVRMAGILNRDRTYTRDFLIRNADKVLFGSDAGWWSFEKPLEERELQFTLFEELDLPEDIRMKIYLSNAEKLFGLRAQGAKPGIGGK